MSEPVVVEPVVVEPVVANYATTHNDCSNKCEEKLDKLINILKSSYRQHEVDDDVWLWKMDLIGIREEICNL